MGSTNGVSGQGLVPAFAWEGAELKDTWKKQRILVKSNLLMKEIDPPPKKKLSFSGRNKSERFILS